METAGRNGYEKNRGMAGDARPLPRVDGGEAYLSRETNAILSNAEELASVFSRLMNDESFYKKASETCREYLKAQLGATESIIKGFKKALF